ncbi:MULTISPECIES: thioesterase II family protein [Streptomyces]|uniref:thioesterase II family protein n=1 Tax=Streptomyces TaxID=1883 RepID=UPI0034393CCC
MTSPHRRPAPAPAGGRAGGHPSWLRQFHPAPPSSTSPGPVRRLVCFPYAGGSAGAYFPLSEALAPGIRVEAVQYPGRQDRAGERPIEDLTVLAEHIARQVAAGGHPAPVLFGHSMGALLAFETARCLEAAHGVSPGLLIVSGMPPPTRLPSVALGDGPEILADLARLRGIDPGLLRNPELQEMILPALRSDHRAVDSYRPAPDATVGCPISVFTGSEDPLLDERAACAWAHHTRRAFRLRVFPGGHFYLDGFPSAVTAAVKAETFLT